MDCSISGLKGVCRFFLEVSRYNGGYDIDADGLSQIAEEVS